MSDTSLVFNLVARDQASGEVSAFQERLTTAAAGIGAAFATALGAGVLHNLDMEAAGDKLAAQLGVGPAEAAELSQVAATVYENAWGDSIDTVNAAVKGVYQNIGDVSSVEGGLEGVTTKALALAETFDQEVGPTTAAVGQMIKTGLAKDAGEAFDILTRGFQTGANKADDLLDTVNEYGTQWRKFGLDGQTAMGLISQGLKAGARDADIVADSIKEFSIRAIDGSESTADGFKAIGLSADDMAARIGKGGTTATDALDLTLDRLRAIEDPVKRDQAAVMLFGTQAEDLGASLYSLDPSTAVDALGKVGGAADKMTEAVGDNPKAALESFKRKVMGDLGAAAGSFAQFATENQAVMEPLAYTLAGLAVLVLVVKGAMMVYAAVSTVVSAAHAVMSASAWTVIGNWMRMMGIGLMAYARIAGAAVLSAATTAAAWVGSAFASIGTWIAAVVRAAVTSAAQFAMMAARAVVWAATMAAQWLIAMGPVGWVIAAVIGLVALIIANWDTIKRWTVAAWNAVWDFIKGAAAKIWQLFLNWTIVGLIIKHWQSIKTGVITKATDLVSWLKGLPGRITRALGSLNLLLYNKGMDLIRGLWNGIKGMGSWLAGQLKSFVSNYIPGPIADALGISSPSKLMADVVGRWIPPGIAEGAEDNRGVLDKTMAGLVDPKLAIPDKPLSTGIAPIAGATAGGGGRLALLVRLDGPESMKRVIREIVAVDGGGNVQATFGST